MGRVVEALQAHTWNSLTLKGQQTPAIKKDKEATGSDGNREESKSTSTSSALVVDNSKSKTVKDKKDMMLDSTALLSSVVNMNNEDDIDELDSIFHRVKEVSLSSREGRFRS